MNKPELSRCYRLLDDGFSLLTVGENKQPNFSWGKNQNEQLSKDQFKIRYDYSGGKFKKDGSEIQPSNGVGIITGYAHLECIDVDLKVFSTTKERKDFWQEYLKLLDDNILDFKKKFVIYRTKNEGYHILYKSKRVVGNKKIASLKGHKEAVIESRGIGGYIFIYDGNNETNLTYSDVDYISDADREMVWEAAKIYNHVEQEPIKPEKKVQETYNTGLTPWEDYDQKKSVADIVSDDLPIIGQTRDKYLVKRHGATSPHSGYIFKDNGFMYLFSTGTIYPHEKLITPYVAYTYKYHNGDFSAAASALYKDGYGERIKKPKPEPKEKIEIPKDDLEFPIEIYPKILQEYIMLCHKTLNSSVDILGCSLLWLMSIITGNSIQIQVKKGWFESVNVWIMLVGKAGVGKTPSINNIVFPIQKQNHREIKKFIKEREKYEYYRSLDKNEQLQHEEVRKPSKSQFIVDDITLEALIDLHEESKNGVGVLKDELAGWLKDMNKYRQGSDLEHWLSSWSGKEINLNRKTAKSAFVERAFIPVMGGIQPHVLSTFYNEDNKENGFIDRMLFCYPDLEPEYYNEKEIDEDYLHWYSEFVTGMHQEIHSKVIQYNDEREIEPRIAEFTEDAKKEWIRIFNELTDKQRSDEENEYMKSMLPKQKSYIPRFALLMNIIYSFIDEKGNSNVLEVDKKSILAAEKLSKYFIAMAKKIKVDNIEVSTAKRILKGAQDKSTKEQIIELKAHNPNITNVKLAELIGVSRQTIQKHIKDLEK